MSYAKTPISLNIFATRRLVRFLLYIRIVNVAGLGRICSLHKLDQAMLQDVKGCVFSCHRPTYSGCVNEVFKLYHQQVEVHEPDMKELSPKDFLMATKILYPAGRIHATL